MGFGIQITLRLLASTSPTTSLHIPWLQLWYKSQEHISLSIFAITRFQEKGKGICLRAGETHVMTHSDFKPNSFSAMAILHPATICSDLKECLNVLLLRKTCNTISVHSLCWMVEANSTPKLYHVHSLSSGSNYAPEDAISKVWGLQVTTEVLENVIPSDNFRARVGW